ncbi:hypothetical protein J6590_046308 [Homalodisca vitripennis]|nr:hypothetical protein J6590_046308 [Homalodisca vitripennis]
MAIQEETSESDGKFQGKACGMHHRGRTPSSGRYFHIYDWANMNGCNSFPRQRHKADPSPIVWQPIISSTAANYDVAVPDIL